MSATDTEKRVIPHVILPPILTVGAVLENRYGRGGDCTRHTYNQLLPGKWYARSTILRSRSSRGVGFFF